MGRGSTVTSVTKISSFKGEFSFLSNFHESPFKVNGIVYPTNEHFYQAQKTFDKNERKRIACLDSPLQAKREGKKLQVRPDWDDVKIDVMREGLKAKFEYGSLLAEMLMATHPAILEEGNTWGDDFWGVNLKTGEGTNWLGHLLMERRGQLLLVRNWKENSNA